MSAALAAAPVIQVVPTARMDPRVRANPTVRAALTSPAGYSGINAVIETKAGIKAEIQVNTPEMIYAKERETVARGILGDDVYDGIAERTGVPGGRGHTLYEERRVLDETDADKAREIESESREYYKNFQ